MNTRGYPWMVFLMSLIAIAPIFGGGEIFGTIDDDKHNGIPGATVFLLNDEGVIGATVTDTLGNYAFFNLEPGTYDVRMQEKPEFIITSPSCGSFTTTIQNGDTRYLVFKIIISGVSVDFGRPAGGGNIIPPIFPEKLLVENYVENFIFTMRIHNMETVEQTPQRFVLNGYFHITSPNVDIIIEDVSLAGGYLSSNADVSFTHGQGPLLQVVLETHEWPYLIPAGDVLIFRGKVISTKGNWLAKQNNTLCLCVQNLTFYQDNSPSEDAELEKFTQPWATCFPVKTN